MAYIMLNLCGGYAHLFIGYYMCLTDRNSPQNYDIEKHQPLSFPGDIMFFLFYFLAIVVCLIHVSGMNREFINLSMGQC